MTTFQQLLSLRRDADALRRRLDEVEAKMERRNTDGYGQIAAALFDAKLELTDVLTSINKARTIEKRLRKEKAI